MFGRKFYVRYLLEKYIHGTEFTVGVVDDFVFDAIEIKPLDKFYDLSAKDDDSKVNYIIPPDSLKEEKYNELKLLALKIHKILECNVISRSDFILNNKDNKFYYLETNTSPGLVVPHSLIPISLKHHGFTMEDLCIFLIENAQYEGMKNKKHKKQIRGIYYKWIELLQR